MRAPSTEPLIAIRIEGNRAISREALEPRLALHEVIAEGAAVDAYLLALDAERIRAAYMKRGFFAVKVTGDVVPGERGQVAVFTVVEGRRAVTRVEIRGLPPELSPSAALAGAALEDGAPFDYDAYDAARQALALRVQDAGYARATIDGQVTADRDAAVATVHYEVVPGVLCRFGKIDVGTARPDLAGAVRARLSLATGDRYSASALASSQAEIYALGRFASVQLVADRGGEGPIIDVKVELVEASRYEFHLGAGAGYELVTWELRGRVGGSWIPENAPLVTATADARGALTFPHGGGLGDVEPKLRILGSLQRTDLWWPRLRGEIEGGYDYQTVEAYTWQGPHLRLGLGSPLGPRWLQLRVGWLIEELAFTGIDPEIAPPATVDAATIDTARRAQEALGLAGSQRLGAYQASLVADLRDNPIEPHRGGYLAITAVAGTPFAGGDPNLHYQQLTPELRGYFSLGGVVVAVRARAGEIFGEGDRVPVTERYYAGGTSSQRGFAERQLAPRVILDASGCSDTGRRSATAEPGSIVIGGAGLIETGVELRREVATLWDHPIGANLFLDGAEVTCRRQALDPHPSQLHWAAGTGLWFKIAGLKIRGDVGYRLNHKGEDDLPSTGTGVFGDFAAHIGIGETY